MSNDDLCGSRASLDETWCAMLLVNDPDAALIGSLRPRPENRLAAALREALEERPREEPSLEEPARLRSRAPFWVAGGLLAGVVALAASFAPDFSANAPARVAVTERAPSPARVGATLLTSQAPVTASVLAAEPAVNAPSAAPAVVATSASVPRAALEAPARAPARKAGTARKPTGKRAHKTRLASNRVAVR